MKLPHLAAWTDFHREVDVLPAEARAAFDLLFSSASLMGCARHDRRDLIRARSASECIPAGTIHSLAGASGSEEPPEREAL